MHRPRFAFTLLELLLVLAVLGLIAAWAWPDFHSYRQGEVLKESARRMDALVAMCRAEAMNETRRYRIEVWQDGNVRARRQQDPLTAPDAYVAIDAPWALTAPLLEDVWVESIQLLPEGPPPIRVVDDQLEFPETEIVLTPVQELEDPLTIDFEPDGSTNSLRWVLRDLRGRGLLMTLDGRLGRVNVEDWEAARPENVQRPEPLPAEKLEELSKGGHA